MSAGRGRVVGNECRAQVESLSPRSQRRWQRKGAEIRGGIGFPDVIYAATQFQDDFRRVRHIHCRAHNARVVPKDPLCTAQSPSPRPSACPLRPAPAACLRTSRWRPSRPSPTTLSRRACSKHWDQGVYELGAQLGAEL